MSVSYLLLLLFIIKIEVVHLPVDTKPSWKFQYHAKHDMRAKYDAYHKRASVITDKRPNSGRWRLLVMHPPHPLLPSGRSSLFSSVLPTFLPPSPFPPLVVLSYSCFDAADMKNYRRSSIEAFLRYERSITTPFIIRTYIYIHLCPYCLQ